MLEDPLGRAAASQLWEACSAAHALGVLACVRRMQPGLQSGETCTWPASILGRNQAAAARACQTRGRLPDGSHMPLHCSWSLRPSAPGLPLIGCGGCGGELSLQCQLTAAAHHMNSHRTVC